MPKLTEHLFESQENVDAVLNDNLRQVNRLEIIDHTTEGKGRVLVLKDIKVYILALQDGGRTLKICVS